MFKLLKSKKGFTLVELMIVVVIMAILVAVAVPIFSAVTSNSRKKTCLSNQREIQAQLNNAEMGGVITLNKGDVFILETNADGDDGSWIVSEGAQVTDTELEELFQKPPICPYEENTIVVTIDEFKIGSSEEAGYKVSTVCNKEGSKEVHGS
jgi:prepilin-type N-terminal cleavage/methylation domain-containing protein